VPIETLYGDLKGLKPSQIKQIQRLYHQRLPGDCLTTPEFAQRIAAIATDIERPICTYVNRRGQVIRVGIGTPRQTQIPPLELPRYGDERLCGIRCIAAQLKDDAPPKAASLTALALQRLDALVTLTLTGEGFQRRGGGSTGYVRSSYLAHLVPVTSFAEDDPTPALPAAAPKTAQPQPTPPTSTPSESADRPDVATVDPMQRILDTPVPGTAIVGPLPLEDLCEQDFLDLVENLEAEFEREFVARRVEGDRERVLVVGLWTDDLTPQAFQSGLQELDRLVDTAGGEVVDVVEQRRSRPHPQTVVGGGKVAEIALHAQTLGASLIVFNRDLSPAQVRNLEKQLGTRVVDRTEVILDIFAQRAQSGAGKLQVELAQLEYMLPRLTGRGQAMSRLGGGIGTRGPGETKLETERRAIQRRISRLQQEVNRLQAHRNRMRLRRQSREVPSVAIVGYTNAGKSTLLNALTNAEVYAEDRLFATLDPTTRRMGVPDQDMGDRPAELLLTDTVGFIHELPPALIDAFRATLEEVTEADALLHLVDLSHPAWQRQITAVTNILSEMPIALGPMLLVFNKIDAVDAAALETAKETFPQAAFISAGDRLGLETLRHRLLQLVHYAGL
jgi:GTP-binding protein HflX